MEKIKEYGLLFITLTVISGLMLVLSPEGNMKKYIKYLCSLCLASALFIPLLTVFRDMPATVKLSEEEISSEQADELQEEYRKKTIEETVINLKESLTDYLCDCYGFSENEIEMEISLDEDDPENVSISSVAVTIPQAERKEEIKKQLEDLFLHRTEIKITAVGKGGEK